MPLDVPESPTNFIQGISSMGGTGEPTSGEGLGIHLYVANTSMSGTSVGGGWKTTLACIVNVEGEARLRRRGGAEASSRAESTKSKVCAAWCCLKI